VRGETVIVPLTTDVEHVTPLPSSSPFELLLDLSTYVIALVIMNEFFKIDFFHRSLVGYGSGDILTLLTIVDRYHDINFCKTKNLFDFDSPYWLFV
jgi:hypothetical protein